MATTIKIDKNVPLPEAQGRGFSAALRKMKVGESIVIPLDARSSIRTLATRLGLRISVRTMENGTHIRVWLVK
jgi:hypothetical protein